MAATRPAARPALTLLQLLLGTANAALSSLLLLGIFDPADELVAGQGRDVLPRGECCRVGNQRFAEVYGQIVHHPTGHLLVVHVARITGLSHGADDLVGPVARRKGQT